MGTRKTLSLLFTGLSLVLILDTFNVTHSLSLFLLAGVIPGTNYSIDATVMLALFAGISGFTLSRIFATLAASASRRIHASTGTMLSAQS